MASDTKRIDPKGILFLILSVYPLIEALDIDCNGSPFHCVNSTHFIICVDIGNGVSRTIDDFMLPCPKPTICKQSNKFECEFPPMISTTTQQAPQPHSVFTTPSTIWTQETINTVSPTTSKEVEHQSTTNINVMFTEVTPKFSTSVHEKSTESFTNGIPGIVTSTSNDFSTRNTDATLTTDSNSVTTLLEAISTETWIQSTTNTFSPTTLRVNSQTSKMDVDEPTISIDPIQIAILPTELTTETSFEGSNTNTVANVLNVTNTTTTNSGSEVITDSDHGTDLPIMNTIIPVATSNKQHTSVINRSESIISAIPDLSTTISLDKTTETYINRVTSAHSSDEIYNISSTTTNEHIPSTASIQATYLPKTTMMVSDITSNEAHTSDTNEPINGTISYSSSTSLDKTTEIYIEDDPSASGSTSDDIYNISSNNATDVVIDPVLTTESTYVTNFSITSTIVSEKTSNKENTSDTNQSKPIISTGLDLSTTLSSDKTTEIHITEISSAHSSTSNAIYNITSTIVNDPLQSADSMYTTELPTTKITDAWTAPTIKTISSTLHRDNLQISSKNVEESIVSSSPIFITDITSEMFTYGDTTTDSSTNNDHLIITSTLNYISASTDSTHDTNLLTTDDTRTKSIIIMPSQTTDSMSLDTSNTNIHSILSTKLSPDRSTKIFINETSSTGDMMTKYTSNTPLNTVDVSELATASNNPTDLPTTINNNELPKTVNVLNPVNSSPILFNNTDKSITATNSGNYSTPLDIKTKPLNGEVSSAFDLNLTSISLRLEDYVKVTSEVISDNDSTIIDLFTPTSTSGPMDSKHTSKIVTMSDTPLTTTLLPETTTEKFVVKSTSSLSDESELSTFPVITKDSHSRITSNDIWVNSSVTVSSKESQINLNTSKTDDRPIKSTYRNLTSSTYPSVIKPKITIDGSTIASTSHIYKNNFNKSAKLIEQMTLTTIRNTEQTKITVGTTLSPMPNNYLSPKDWNIKHITANDKNFSTTRVPKRSTQLFTEDNTNTVGFKSNDILTTTSEIANNPGTIADITEINNKLLTTSIVGTTRPTIPNDESNSSNINDSISIQVNPEYSSEIDVVTTGVDVYSANTIYQPKTITDSIYTHLTTTNIAINTNLNKSTSETNATSVFGYKKSDTILNKEILNADNLTRNHDLTATLTNTHDPNIIDPVTRSNISIGTNSNADTDKILSKEYEMKHTNTKDSISMKTNSMNTEPTNSFFMNKLDTVTRTHRDSLVKSTQTDKVNGESISNKVSSEFENSDIIATTPIYKETFAQKSKDITQVPVIINITKHVLDYESTDFIKNGMAVIANNNFKDDSTTKSEDTNITDSHTKKMSNTSVDLSSSPLILNDIDIPSINLSEHGKELTSGLANVGTNDSSLIYNLNKNSTMKSHNSGNITQRKDNVNRLTNTDSLSVTDNRNLKNNVTVTIHTSNSSITIHLGDSNINHTAKFDCLHQARGRYADSRDCRKFYICIGKQEPITGMCPVNTVFSEIWKQCTTSLSHCFRNHQFLCTTEGRFIDVFQDDIYYICIKKDLHSFYRVKFKCLNGYHLNKMIIKCISNADEVNEPISAEVDTASKTRGYKRSTTAKEETEKPLKFECTKEGVFADPADRSRYYVCKKQKSQYRKKNKKCDNDETFDNEKKKCVDADSIEF